MWRLSIEDDEANRTVVNLVRKEYSIGRAEENSVRLTERNVSRLHAILRRTSDGWVIEDLKSHTGSFVNERRVEGIQPIDHRDKIRIGDYDISLLDSEREAEEASIDKQTETVPSAAEGDEQLDRHDRLVVVEGPNPGTQYPLVDKKILLGRGEECDIALQDTSVSRVHASLTRDEHGRYHISDQKSSNGVRVNGMEITKIPLYAGDVVELGDVHLQFVPKGSRFDETAVRAGAQTAAAGPGTSGFNKAWLALGALVLMGVVVWAAPERRDAQTVAETPVVTEAALVDQAEALAAAHDFDGAIALVRGLPTNSAAKASAKYRGIVNSWADAQFQRVESIAEPTTQRALLQSVVDFIDVDPARRARAQAHLDSLNRPVETDVGDTSTDGNSGESTAPRTAASSGGSSTVPTTSVAPQSTTPLPPQVNVVAARPVYVPPTRPASAVAPPPATVAPSAALPKPSPQGVTSTTPVTKPLPTPAPSAAPVVPVPPPASVAPSTNAPAPVVSNSASVSRAPAVPPAASPTAAPPVGSAPSHAPNTPITSPSAPSPARPSPAQPSASTKPPTPPSQPVPPVVNWPGATP